MKINNTSYVYFSGDAHLSNLRSSAYEAVMDLVKNSPKDVYPAITQTFGAVLEKMVAILKMEEQGKQVGDYSQHNDFKSLLCATLQVCNLHAFIKETLASKMVDTKISLNCLGALKSS